MILGEVPPTGGLLPRLTDLLARGDASAFARAISRRAGTQGAVVTPSGAAGLVLLLTVLMTRQPDRRLVVVPAYTCPLVVLAIAQAGLTAIACDLAPGGLALDLAHLERLLARDVLAVLPTHYGGWLADVDAVMALVAARAPAVTVIEDAAQAYGAIRDGRSAGALGHAGVFSFSMGKGLTLAEGGAVVAHDSDLLAAVAREAATRLAPSRATEALRAAELVGYHLLYRPLGLRLAFGAPKRRHLRRGDMLAAARDVFPDGIAMTTVGRWRQRFGAAAERRLDAHLTACRARFDTLADRLSLIPWLTVLRAPGTPTATQLFALCDTHERAEAVLASLWPSRLGAGPMFARAIGDYPALRGKLAPSDTPLARDLIPRLVSITTSPLLPERYLDKLVSRIAAAGNI